MAVKVTVDYNHLDNVSDEIEQAVGRALTDGAAEIQGTAQSIVPVDTGRLRASISMRPSGDGWDVFAQTEYDEFVEYGTRHMAAQPYMRPAYERHRPGIIAACEAAIRRHAAGK